MELKVEKLKNSRAKFSIKANAKNLEHAAEHAFTHVTAHATVKGFRPGKAPRPLLVQAVSKGRILSELVDHALPELLEEAAKKENLILIEAPSYSLEKLCELNDDGTPKSDTSLEFSAEADYAPDIQVGDYHKIKIKPTKVEPVTDKEIDEILTGLVDRRATFEKVARAAKKDDRVEIDFTGKRNGIPEDRLASKHHPIIIGSNVMIPGFEDQLIGKKVGDTTTFEITFPKDYHAKDLANQKVVFEVLVHEVSEKKLPEINDGFAKELGKKNVAELREAIKQEQEFTKAEQAKEADQSATLEAFLPLVKGEIPKSLIEREIDRQVDTLRQQAATYGLKFENYLEHIKKTEEELREEMRPTAEKAVIIGLGLGEVVEKEGLKHDQNAGQAAIEKLVEIATTQKNTKNN